MKQFADYHAPTALADALGVLAEKGAATRIIAGGTDVMVRVKRGMIPEEETTLLSVHELPELGEITVEGGVLSIGAATTATDLIRDPLVEEHVPILAVVADRLASAQIRNLATVGGNLANASPAGDLINPLLLLDAAFEAVTDDDSVLGYLLRYLRYAMAAIAGIFLGPLLFVKLGTQHCPHCSVPIRPQSIDAIVADTAETSPQDSPETDERWALCPPMAAVAPLPEPGPVVWRGNDALLRSALSGTRSHRALRR